ncbi:mannosyltransferase [Aureobasidium sp. EXF-10727]|nr:mannosyltransferase [Aureobasidium sp. EXF-10727]
MAPPDRSGSSLMLADLRTLACLFCAWKLLLLCIAYASPGPGYDTSTTLLLARAQPSVTENTLLEDFAKRLVSKLVRWDALYFVSVAQRGYLFEQEWAWGWGYTKFLSLISKGWSSASDFTKVPRLNSTSVLSGASSPSPLYLQAYAGVLISHVSHLLSVFMLYGLIHHLPIMNKVQRRKVAFVAASLHIFSSAGLFLSAPYAESLFSMLNFLGVFLHTGIPCDMPLHKYGPSSLIRLLLSGISFGLATTVRSNGIFSGLIYLHHVYMLLHSRINIHTIVTIAVIGLSAMAILSGMVLPQYMAYQDFCAASSGADIRPWCSRTLPSVYSWVQEHYWNVGFLRYWTISNIPLFLLALPMLCILIGTGLAAPDLRMDVPSRRSVHASVYVLCLASSQILLALLAFTTFHVQIVNRIATGYPMWYVVIAAGIVSPNTLDNDNKTTRSSEAKSLVRNIQDHLGRPSTQQIIFRGMFMYSIIQGGLYASFMPPA